MTASFLFLSVLMAINGPTAPSASPFAQQNPGPLQAAPAPRTPSSGPQQTLNGDPVLKHCLVSLIEEVQLPGREPGVLAAVDAKEGMQVKAGDVLGRIDDSEAVVQKRVKTLEYETAKEQATNDVDVRYAAAAADVAKYAWMKAVEANQKSPSAVPKVEVLRLQLDHRRAELQIEKAQLDRRVAALTAETKQAEVAAVDTNIERRQLKSPIDGIVVNVYRHLGEWVPPGEAVMRIVRINRLRIEGFLNISEFGPEEIGDRQVTVEVELARGKKLRFPGKITFVNTLVQAGGEYKVWAEVENREENGQWLLRPGLNVTMQIHMR